jgi:hypothetical protein
VLASGIVAVIMVWNALAARPAWTLYVLAGVTILVGLLAGWAMTRFGRRWVVVT